MWQLYQTTNLVNRRYYIGVHDGHKEDYLGSGVALRAAIRKYGRHNFRKDILAECETKDFAYRLEAAVVTLEFVASAANYNIKCGGIGGSLKGGTSGRKPGFHLTLAERQARRAYRHTDETKQKIAARRGWKHTEETLAKMRKRARKRSASYWAKWRQTRTGCKRVDIPGGTWKFVPVDEFRRSPLA